MGQNKTYFFYFCTELLEGEIRVKATGKNPLSKSKKQRKTTVRKTNIRHSLIY